MIRVLSSLREVLTAHRMTEEDRVKLVGEIRAERSVPLVRDLVGTFFHRNLRR